MGNLPFFINTIRFFLFFEKYEALSNFNLICLFF